MFQLSFGFEALDTGLYDAYRRGKKRELIQRFCIKKVEQEGLRVLVFQKLKNSMNQCPFPAYFF